MYLKIFENMWITCSLSMVHFVLSELFCVLKKGGEVIITAATAKDRGGGVIEVRAPNDNA